MKTYLTYGGLMALASALLTLLLFFFGFHTSEKFIWGAVIQFALGLGIGITGVILGIKAKRAENGASGISYGQAFLAGLMICVVSSIIGTFFATTYAHLINPAYQDVAVEWSASMLEKQGASEEKIEQMKEKAREGRSIAKEVAYSLIGGVVFGGVISLIAAAFLKRAPTEPSNLAGD